MKIKARGQLRHHFWGEYEATMILFFDSPEHASLALLSCLLGDGWFQSKRRGDCLAWHGGSAQLELAKTALGKLGADTGAIDSLARSVDFGEPWSIELDVVDPRQLSLFVPPVTSNQPAEG